MHPRTASAAVSKGKGNIQDDQQNHSHSSDARDALLTEGSDVGSVFLCPTQPSSCPATASAPSPLASLEQPTTGGGCAMGGELARGGNVGCCW